MSDYPRTDSRDDVLAADALGEVLTEDERMQLDARDESLLRAAAALELVWTTEAMEMPRAVRDRVAGRLAALADDAAARQPALRLAHAEGDQPGALRLTPGLAATGWIAAAAAVMLAFVGWMRSPDAAVAPGGGPSVVEARGLSEQWASFAADHADARRAEWGDWALGDAGPEVQGVRGEVVWSERDQTGLMRFVGLPENDPRELQYQLWIVDRRGLFDETGQSARISGGVFDAAGAERLADGSIVVPIRPALTVQQAGAFAITIEQPGGVWASDMSRRVVIAALGA